MIALLQSIGGAAERLRVVRGDDWEWEDQDGGEGCIGSVVKVGGWSDCQLPDKTVIVVWDTGVHAVYRAGYEGKNDLRVFDTAKNRLTGSTLLPLLILVKQLQRCLTTTAANMQN